MNYLVDTCILSELAKRRPNAKVAKWLSGHSSSSQFFVSAVTVGEIMEGIESLPPEDIHRTQEPDTRTACRHRTPRSWRPQIWR